MRCIVCESLSFSPLCDSCQQEYLRPTIRYRTLSCGLKVLYFFEYDEIDMLLKTKHTEVGHAIFTLLSKRILHPFSQGFEYPNTISVLPIDDRVKQSYSHTAIMAHQCKSTCLKPSYDHLHARSTINYSRQSIAFREAHKRDFDYKKAPYDEIILLDDIVTTGTTLCEAKKAVEQMGQEVLLGVVFANVTHDL